MKTRYLEVTFRKGKPIAAYLYLPRKTGVKSVKTETAAPGILVDFAAGGVPIGLEITVPGKTAAAQVNEVLKSLGLTPMESSELSPLEAA